MTIVGHTLELDEQSYGNNNNSILAASSNQNRLSTDEKANGGDRLIMNLNAAISCVLFSDLITIPILHCCLCTKIRDDRWALLLAFSRSTQFDTLPNP